MLSQSISLPLMALHVTARSESIAPVLCCEELELGLFLVHLKLEDAGRAFQIPPLQWHFEMPVVDIHGVWHPNAERNTTAYLPCWNSGFNAQATAGAPVFCVLNHADQNRLTAALCDAVREVTVEIKLSEERAALLFLVEGFHKQQVEHAASYEATLRLDFRARHFSRGLGDVAQWWAAQPDKAPAPVPPLAREAVLSTWYSMHQQVTPQLIEDECARSRELGCRVVIVDDGWQTADNGRGYGFCGDWEIDEGKMPAMAAHVARVQELGLSYMLWIAPLFMGDHMKNQPRFEGRFLYRNERWAASILDPRFPEVRRYLVETFVRLMRELNLDGFKIDFVDLVGGAPAAMSATTGEGRDIDSIPVAMDALLVEMTSAFRAFKPDFLVEFRQSYVGPLMRKYGNMFRAGDCPNDFERNRFRTLAIRLLSGNTPSHADMFMWHPHDTPENAARQMLASLFAVPQISVLLETIAPAHLKTLQHWLGFWRAHREVLLDGELLPLKPHLGFPVVLARTATQQIAAVYDEVILPLTEAPPDELIVVNAGFSPRVALECAQDFGTRRVAFFDLNGEQVGQAPIQLNGVQSLPVPVCGYALCR